MATKYGRARHVWIAALAALSHCLAGDGPVFDLARAKPDQLAVSEGVDLAAAGGRDVSLGWGQRLAVRTQGLRPDEFTIELWVKHDRPLRDYFFQRLTYFYHETPDLKNRIGLRKREGTSYLLLFIGNDQGRGKGHYFGGDFFSLATPELDWSADTWHHLVCVASRKAKRACLYVDGALAAEAKSTELPAKLHDSLWVGSVAGKSPARAMVRGLRLWNEARFEPRAPRLPKPAPGQLIHFPPVQPRRRLSGKEFTLNLDYFDVVIGIDCWDLRDSQGEMRRLMALASHYGVDRVLYRVSVCGAVSHHSRVMAPARHECFTRYPHESLDTCCGNIPSLRSRLSDVLEAMDPLAECVKWGHMYGMEIWAWVTVFDSMYYAPAHEFFQQHPEYTWASRDGKKHIPGVPCYGHPEVRAHRLAQMRELSAYGVDGIYLSTRSHSPWPGRRTGGSNEGARRYGFNQPVIDAYLRRYGSDPRQAEPDSIDAIRFVQTKGDFLTQFLREVKAVTSGAGQRLAISSTKGGANPITADRMFVDVDRLVREGIVDEISILGNAGTDLRRFRVLSDNRAKVTVWQGIHGSTYDRCVKLLRAGLGRMFDNPTIHGACFHEFANVSYLDLWEEGIESVAKGRSD